MQAGFSRLGSRGACLSWQESFTGSGQPHSNPLLPKGVCVFAQLKKRERKDGDPSELNLTLETKG